MESFIIIFLIISLFITFLQTEVSLILLPVTFCGLICLNNIIGLVRKGNYYVNIYFYVWLFSLIASFFAPLITLYRDIWVIYMDSVPASWDLYGFIISTMNLVGLVIWNIILKDPSEITESNSIRIINPSWKLILSIYMSISVILQIYIYQRFGGISGYIHAYTVANSENNAFAGMGAIFLISESFPYTLLLYIIINNMGKEISRGRFFLYILILFIVVIFFGGLKGSRSNTLLFIVIAIVAFDIYLYKLKSNDIVIFLIAFFLFMFVGRIYKDYGEDFMQATTTKTSDEFEISSAELTIIGDLSRFGINAYELYKLTDDNNNYDYYYGQTYAWAVLSYIPGGYALINKFNITGRSEAASILFYKSKDTPSSRILGPIGEWFINFGYWTFFVPYILLGLILRKLRTITLKIRKENILYLVLPSILIFIPQLILSDMSNIVFFFIKRVVIVYLIIISISHKENYLA